MIHCKHEDCKYRGLLSENISYCNYIGHMHQSRHCDPATCDKYVPKIETCSGQNPGSEKESSDSDGGNREE